MEKARRIHQRLHAEADGETNASLRAADSVESISPERAAELLQDRRDRGPAPKKKRAAKKRS